MARNHSRTPIAQGRRPLPTLRTANTKVETTLGDLIAAAYDTVGSEADVARLLSSRALRKAAGRRIVVVQ